MSKEKVTSIHWFRKGLRLHDNPGLVAACKVGNPVYPVVVMDPFFAKPDQIGVNRYSFYLESLRDLDNNLRSIGSRLFVLRGKPDEQIPLCIQRWNAGYITFEQDTELYARHRDHHITDLLTTQGVKVESFTSHTLANYDTYISALKGKPAPSSNGGFLKLFDSVRSQIRKVERAVSRQDIVALPSTDLNNPEYSVPTLEEMGYTEKPTHTFPGGETEALRRLRETVQSRPAWVASFAKPETSPNSLQPSTTVLSPYLKTGCISSLYMYEELEKLYSMYPGKHTMPPVSLHGQLMWREFFYFCSVHTPNFDKMVGNPSCRQIPWSKNDAFLQAWKNGRTGYPYIDAIMTQLRKEGWIHHLARHSVACFLTRGDLWQSWEDGAKVFELYLLDADWALNNANWQWLSCSNFFYQYFRVYSPIAFGKKTDKTGDYIRKYIPQLAKYPEKYIYEPWKAPLALQQSCGCVIGKDYPLPIVDHDIASKENMGRMKEAYALHGGSGDPPDEETSIGNAIASSSSLSAVANKSSASNKKSKDSGAMDKFIVKKPKL